MTITLNNQTLDALDMQSLVEKITVYQEYFTLPAGQEHYRLLRHIASQIDGNITELGTHAATSVVAMSSTAKKHIVTYDIIDEKHRSYEDLDNVTFRLCEFDEDAGYKDFILNSKMIFIDAPHDGTFETRVYNWLKANNYKGLTIWDDIHLNDPMKTFWSMVDLPKQDISKYGHITGTGAIYFGDEIELVEA
jgi:hypothetical protein